MRIPLIAGNWKMNKTPYEAGLLIEKIKEYEISPDVEAVFCVPSIDIPVVREHLEGTNFFLGAQNFFSEKQGAYTGEISGPMLKDYGVEYLIIGHSERRTIFGEDDEMIHKKLISALNQGFLPILCVGESLKKREAGKQEEKVKKQLEKALEGLDTADFANLSIAYEPIWAIGTGKSASKEDAQEMASFIREEISKVHGQSAADKVRILYGGSVNVDNIKELMDQKDIDGVLVGGASLRADSFAQMINFQN